MPTMEMPDLRNARNKDAEATLVAERIRVAKRVPLFFRFRELHALPVWEQREVAIGEARSFAERRSVRYGGWLWSAMCLSAWWSYGQARYSLAPMVVVLLAGVLLPTTMFALLVRRKIRAEVCFRKAVRENTGTGV